MGEVPPLTELYRKYRSRGFQFFIVYVREAHPGENYPHHASPKQKLAHARKLRELEKVHEIPILVDDFEGTTHSGYGLLPNMVYLIEPGRNRGLQIGLERRRGVGRDVLQPAPA